MQRLQYVDEMSYKLQRGIQEIKFNDIYDEWVKIDTYRKVKGTVMCECNNRASLKVSESPQNPGRPFFACRNQGGCRFFQWADVGFTKKIPTTTKNVQRIWRVLKYTEKQFHYFVNNVFFIFFKVTFQF